MRRAEAIVVGAVGLHLVLSVTHGVVHEVVPAEVPRWQLLFVVVALFAVPLLGAALLSRGRERTGGALVLVSAVAGFAFEALAHFVVENPDHVSRAGHAAFAPTAAGSTLGTGVAAVAAGWFLWRHAQGGSVNSSIDSST